MSLPRYLRDIQEEIEGHARGYGLDFYTIIFEILDYKRMNEVAAYGGFPTRYPHWRFGMEYESLSKGHSYGLSKIYEMVINNVPSFAYLLEGNSIVDQKMVMAHVCGHVDFFKNNYSFSKTNRKMIDGMANHAMRIRRHVERFGLDKVEGFIDTCLSLDNLIDPMSPFITRRAPKKTTAQAQAQEEVEPEKPDVPRLRAKSYMDKYINPPDFVQKQREKLEQKAVEKTKFPEQPERDVLLFLIEHAPLEKWERDVLEIVRDEAYYFAPQGQTKVLNEGWACIHAKSLVFSADGLIPMASVVAGDASAVSDGKRARKVYGRNIIPNHPTITVSTRRGLSLCGSNNHRVLLSDGVTWKRLDQLVVGDSVAIAGGVGLWPKHKLFIGWEPERRGFTQQRLATQAGLSCDTVRRYANGMAVSPQAAAAIVRGYDEMRTLSWATRRKPIEVPDWLDERLAAFAGYLVGDGHISRVKRHLGLTTGDEEQAMTFLRLGQELFGVLASMRRDGGRWRVLIHSETVSDFLVDVLGLTVGPSARFKQIPDGILRSPEPVVRAFLRAYFDCDGYAGDAGVILSTMSDRLAEQVQLLLLNYGILSRKRRQTDGCWHVHVMGASAKRFAEKIGFGLTRKQEALEAYVVNHHWYKEERWEDEVVSLESGVHDVYDISVEETHRYAACGFINHNSYWHSKIMTEKVLNASEIIDYADHASGVMATSPGQLNPYKLGIELLRHIEDRWNRGRFGKEWEECDSLEAKRSWDKRLGLGRRKIFEVRKLYSDVTFIDEFFTEEFCREHRFFNFGYNERSGNWEIESREFKKIKERLLFQLTNFGQPFIYVEDGNFENRSELLLRHHHEGVDLKMDHAKDTLQNLQRVWKRPVNLLTKIDGKGKLLRFDGRDHSEKAAEYPEK